MVQGCSLKKSAYNGVFWSAIDKVFSKGLSLIVSIILARILLPEDFGLIGMLTIFLAVSQLILDSGFSQALVQKHTPSQSDFSTAFFFNVIIGLTLYIILYFCAPCISSFYQAPILTTLLRVLGLTLITGSLSVVQRAMLLIRIDFKRIALINVVSVVLSSVVALWAAYNDYGVWSLAIQTVSTQVISTLLFWTLGKWVPSFAFSMESFNVLFRFGSKLLAAGFVATIVNNLYNLIIGKIYHTQELGFYTKGRELSEAVSMTVNDIINSVTFPLLSSVKENQERMISIYSKMLSMTAFVIFPTMTLMAVLTKPLVVALLTEKWLPAVPIIQWLCMSRMFTPISALNMNILNAIGRSDLYMKLDLSKLPLTLITMAITIPISIDAVVIGNFIVTFICYFINAYLPGKMLNFGVMAQMKIFWKIIVSTIISSLLPILVIIVFDDVWIQILLGSLIGIVGYFFASKLFGVEEIKEVKNIFTLIRNVF